MKRIFICSPYRGNIRMNTARAIYYAEQVAAKGNIPIVPHLYFPIFLDENDPAERVKGIDMGLELMAVEIKGRWQHRLLHKELLHMNELKKELEDIRSNIPYNTYRTILGQIRAGHADAAKVGIERIKRREVKKHGYTCH